MVKAVNKEETKRAAAMENSVLTMRANEALRAGAYTRPLFCST
jgi:hypothetical protein